MKFIAITTMVLLCIKIVSGWAIFKSKKETNPDHYDLTTESEYTATYE